MKTLKDIEGFSLHRYIQSILTRDESLAEREFEASKKISDRFQQKPSGVFMPTSDEFEPVSKRDLNVTTDTAGGFTVETSSLGQSFVNFLHNRMVIKRLGALLLPGLVGDVTIPRQATTATAYWLAESGAATESQQSFQQIAMSPKTVGAFVDFSRALMLQSSIAIESFLRADLATVLALAIDLAAINGTGAGNQPTGILQTSGIGSVAGGTNGLAPTYAHMVQLESAVANNNADVGSLAYLTNSAVRGKLKTVEKASDTGKFVWEPDRQMRPGFGVINGTQAAVSNQVPSNLTKGSSSGVCSAIIYGNWNDLIIGMWGACDILVDVYTGSSSGTVRVVALQSVDCAVRHPESFAAMTDALTS